jgi:MOSC domain-containing protein YiiM
LDGAQLPSDTDFETDMTTPHLLSVQVSLPRWLEHEPAGARARRRWWTGFDKRVVAGPVRLARTGLAGDGQACVGDSYAIGEAVLQVSMPRLPCGDISRRWGRKDLTARVRASGRTGWYFRVLREGSVEAGTEVELRARLSRRLGSPLRADTPPGADPAAGGLG